MMVTCKTCARKRLRTADTHTDARAMCVKPYRIWMCAHTATHLRSGATSVLGGNSSAFFGFRALNSNIVPPFFHKT